MGEKIDFQPLTGGDRASVLIYRTGIALTAVLLVLGGFLFLRFLGFENWNGFKGQTHDRWVNIYIILLYISAGMSVLTMHLYVKRFRRLIKGLYIIAVLALFFVLVQSSGRTGSVVFESQYGGLFLLPISICIGFIGAKEAFCFRLNEGFLLAVLLPLFVLFLSSRALSPRGTGLMLLLISGVMVLFAVRKVPMPLHYDIGDKSAYET